MTRRALSLAGWLALLAAASPAAAVPFRADSRLEPRVVGLGERIRFTIEAQGPGFEQPRLRPRFELDNLEIVAGPDSSHGISIGSDSGWRYAWTWWLEAKTVGPAAVRRVYLLVGDREVELPTRRIEVLRESLPGRQRPAEQPPQTPLEELLRRARERLRRELGANADDGGRPQLFLRAVAAPERPYVGQRVVYTVYLFTRVPVRSVEPESLPTFQGLWARHVNLPSSSGEVVEWEGALYTRTPLLSKELFARTAQVHRLEPLRARFLVERIRQDRLFSVPVREPVQVVAESNPVELAVRPLPPPDEAGVRSFSGTVGRLALGAELAPAEVAVGQGATLTVTATGDGHLEGLGAPPVAAPPGTDLIGPQPVPSSDGGDPGTARSWQYLLVPRRPGSFRVPAVSLSYFDPDAAEYRVARTVPPALTARPATEADPSISSPPRPIRSAAVPPPVKTLWRSTLPWAFALPWAAALVLVLARRRPGVRDGGFQARLEASLREEHPRRVAAGIEAAWRGLLAESLAVPECVPTSRWTDRLVEHGISRDVCRRLGELVEDLHFLRFAPELSATSALAAEIVERSERLAREILPRR